MRYSNLTDEEVKKILFESGAIEVEKLDQVAQRAKEEKRPITEIAIEQGFFSDEALAGLIADALTLPFISLEKNFPARDALLAVPEIVARKKRLIPFKKDEAGLHLAMADPTDMEIINFIERKDGVPVIIYVATNADIDRALELYGKGLTDLLSETQKENGGDEKKQTGEEKDSGSIIQIVKKIITEAYNNRASDIHIEPSEEGDSIVRFRIDGVLHDVTAISESLHSQVISRIKVMAKLRTDEHQIPQDGKLAFEVENEKSSIDVRVSIVPVTEGEKAVLRLLAERSRQFLLSSVGMSEENLKKIREAYEKPYGMILATGPTGCGKTTTLYAILKQLNNRQVNIMTIEDPVEYDMEGVNQIQVNPKAQLTFATGLRSILRQDPNIIFVGEIRDAETAGIAVNLALTGHLVLSSLHTNDAATAVPRFVDLGIEPFLVASTASVIIAQRLVRKIHDNCRASEEISVSELAQKIGWEMTKKIFGMDKTKAKETVRFYRGKGCEACQKTGYQGRLGIFEVMVVDDQIREAISAGQDASVILELAKKAGMRTMLEDGLEKVKLGVTTIDEVLSATKL